MFMESCFANLTWSLQASLTLQETRSIHDSKRDQKGPKIEFITYIYILL